MFDYSSTAQAVKERTLIKNVYMWMAAGLALTGITSLWMASDPNRMVSFVQGGTMWLLFIAELVLVFYLSARILSMKPLTATLCFAGYSILNGLTLSVIFYAYTMESITSTFFITAATFGGMALYATITKRDLSTMGHYLGMALWGLIIAAVVNMFLKSSSFDLMISGIGVLVFCGLTAYDTQYILNISRNYSGSLDESDYVRFSIIGALKLYLDFINMFLYMLRFVGRRK
ncbi:MAG: Bax inhibitor-1/YccA family protein [Spirochaetia bacterium]|nr:Bax inhibitor-1/YccA family protein [Spirochaetia bacterium]MBR0318296.1 Bax inhibitor-1/YccA family protein [Spirochaetia bacterium]